MHKVTAIKALELNHLTSLVESAYSYSYGVTSDMTRRIETTGLCGLILFHILNAVLCIPITEFYPFGGDASGFVQGLASGHNVFSRRFWVAEPIWFYGEAQRAVIVSS